MYGGHHEGRSKGRSGGNVQRVRREGLVFDALRDAVNLARDRQIRTLRALRAQLETRGHKREHVDEAIQCWATYENRKPIKGKPA